MATAKWRLTSGTGSWSTASDWTPAAPLTGDDVIIGSSLDTGNVLVTEDVTLTINKLTMAANGNGSKSNTTTLTITPDAILTVNGPISLGKNAIINGTGTFFSNGAISGGGTITASSGLFDLEGNGSITSGGAVLAIGTASPSTLKLNLAGGVTASGVDFSNVNQTLLIGPAGAVTFTANEKVINGAIQMAGGKLTDSNGITLGSQSLNGKLSGFGIVDAVLSMSGKGTANVVTASGGLLDLKRSVTGLGLAIDSAAPARLLIEGTASTPTAIALNSANQTLEIGAAGKLTIAVAESVTNATIQLDGGGLADSAGFTLGSGASLVGSGTVTGGISGTGLVKASGGVLDLLSGVTSTSTTFIVDANSGSVLELAGTATLGTTFSFAGPSGWLELADIANGVVQQFNGTIVGLNVGTSATAPTNAVNIQTTVTSATLSGSSISILNGSTNVATLRLSSAPSTGASAFVLADAILGGYDVFLAPIPPKVTWSAAPGSVLEGTTIALGTITPTSGNPLQSVLVSGITVGSTLSDGTNSFTASSGNTSVNILGWNYAALTLTTSNDLNPSLTVQVTDTAGTISTPATETVAVNPLAPGVAPLAVSGVQGQQIALNLGLGVNGLSGDTNTLASVTISNIPSGATLSNTHGDTLTINNGSITFNAAQLVAGVLNGLALTTIGAGTFNLTVSATEQDSEGNTSTTVTGVETVTIAPAPTVTWSAATGAGVEGQAIALGTITPSSSNPLQSVLVSGITVGSKLSDGTNSFTASSGNTSVNILGWNYSALSLTPSNDLNASLTVQITDTSNASSAPATEAVTVNPLAPGVAPVGVSGVQGQPIALNLGLNVNGLSADTNTLASVTISNIPSGATLSNSHGDTLTIANGSITFNAAQFAGGILTGLALTVPSSGTFALGVSATEQDSEGNLSAGVSGTEQVIAAAPPTSVPTYSHIVVVFEDSQPYLYNRFNFPQGIVGNPTASYINNTLIPGGALLTNYFGISYPGEPNYLAAYAGSTFGVTDNGSYNFAGPTLDSILATAGKTFTGYVEQQNGPQDPWLSFPEANTVQQNFSGFASSDFASLPTVSFIMPSLDNDMDAGTVGQGDTWLRNNLGAYAQWALNNNSLLVVTTNDDGDRSQNNNVATVLYGANVTPGTSSTSYNAYNLLNTLLAGYGLTAPNNAAGVTPIQVFNTSTGTGAPPSVSWSAATVSGLEAQELVPGTITPSSIALGTLTLSSSGNPVQSVSVSGIPVGATLTDGVHSFTAQLGSTIADISGWNYSTLSITPNNDANMSLIAQATDTAGNRSAAAIESVTVTPLAPTIAPLVVAGVAGQRIGLIPGVNPNGVNGESNSLYSVTLSGVPDGATLSNTNGDTLTVNNNSITFNATQLAGGVLNGLAITIGNLGSYQLGVSAIEQDAEGNLSASASGSETVTALSPSPVPTYSHIVVVVEENRNYGDIVGGGTAPYIDNTLIAGGALLTNFWAPTHPSEPDHLALYAGSTFGVTDNGVNSFPDPTLYTSLTSAGKTFVGYAEQPYSWGLEPWQNFPEGNSVQQDFSTFPQSNFASLPTVSFVIPNLGDNMHNGTVDEGDTWLKNNLGAYAQWAANPANNSLLVVTWDEDAGEVPLPNQVAGILYGAGVVPGTYDTPYNFYNMVSTLVNGYGAVGPNYSSQQGSIQVFDPAAPHGNVFILDASNTALVLSGPSNMVFLNGATSASITDDPTGIDHLKLVVEPAGGSLSITNFSTAAGAEIDLPTGFGGFTSSSQVLAALQPDQAGGTLLQAGGQLAVDFVHVLPSAFQNANFAFA